MAIIKKKMINTKCGYYQKDNKRNIGDKREKRESSCHVGGNVNWCHCCGGQYGGSSKC